MRRTISLAAALFAALTLHAADLTVDEILARNAAAKGGLEKIHALQSIRMSGTMAYGPMEAPFVVTKKRPESVKIDFTVQGMTASQSYDGTTGWAVTPFLGRKDPEPLSGDDLRLLREQADFDGPLVDSAKKGHTIELLGSGTIDGTPVYNLRLVTKEGSETLVAIDAASFLEIRIEGRRRVQGQEMETETTIGNYQNVDGLLFAHSIESRVKGTPTAQIITFEKIELNPPVDDAAFRMPEKKAAEAAKP
ncbi:MAG TPA: hypothetical protein VFO89_03635 [Thermoanaerobaculia bacterium]|nr:hypothetical protein [Thermoanaerobaculia bacterium]